MPQQADYFVQPTQQEVEAAQDQATRYMVILTLVCCCCSCIFPPAFALFSYSTHRGYGDSVASDGTEFSFKQFSLVTIVVIAIASILFFVPGVILALVFFVCTVCYTMSLFRDGKTTDLLLLQDDAKRLQQQQKI